MMRSLGCIVILFMLLPDVSNCALLGDFNSDGVVSISEVQTCINSFIGIIPNSAPIANAGADQSASLGAVVTLDGSNSSDANGDQLTYSWSFTSKPAGSSAALSSANVAKPTFTADLAGAYVLNLVVNDGKANSDASTVTINATPPLLKSGDILTLSNVKLEDGSNPYLQHLAIDNAGVLYLSSQFGIIYKMNIVTGAITKVAGGGDLLGDNGPATSANLKNPGPVAIDTVGNIYIPDTDNNRIRKVTISSGIITTIAGNVTAGFSGDNGLATSALLYKPSNIALDSIGNVYFSDSGNGRVRKINIATGVITTVAGGGSSYTYDIIANNALLVEPAGLAFDSAGNLYIADKRGPRIAKVTISTGIITVIAGTNNYGYAGDNGPATSARLYYPFSIAFDSLGNLFFTDTANKCVRKVALTTGIITTVAGNGAMGYAGDNGPATSANLQAISDIVFDGADNFYITDMYNIRKVLR